MADRILNQTEITDVPDSLNELRTQATQTPVGTSGQGYETFLTQLMDLLKRSQTLGTRGFQERQFGLQEQQVGRLMAEAEPGMPPNLQQAIRSAEVSAIQPSITGTAQRGRTFAEQLAGFGDALSQANMLAKSLFDIEQEKTAKARQEQQDLREALWKTPEAFRALPPEQQAQYEKLMGLPKGYIADIPATEQKTIASGGKIFEKDPTTGQWGMVYDTEAETTGAFETLARQYLNGDQATKKAIDEQLTDLTPTVRSEFYTAMNKIQSTESKEMTDEEIKADIQMAKTAGKTAEDIANEIAGDWTIANKERYLEILNEMTQTGELESGIGPIRQVGGFFGGLGKTIGKWAF